MVGNVQGPALLLVSSDSEILALMESLGALVPDLRLECCADYANAHCLIRQDDTALVVVHAPRADNQRQVVDLLQAVADAGHLVASVIITDDGDDMQRAELLRAGAAFCVPRNVNLRKLAHLVDTLTLRARSFGADVPDISKPDPEVADPDPSFYVLSPDMMQMMEQVRRVVPQDTTILFTGETGTGKTRLARVIHDMSPRRAEPFLVVDCNALSPSLIESELFGHVRGSFTGADRDRPGKFAAAGKGTLVLDEINSLPLPLQSKLLRVVDDRVIEPVGSNKPQPLRARLIAISNASLEQEVAAGRFRADLYFRLNVVGFFLPPLRERVNAIGALAQRFLMQFAANHRPDLAGITPEALRALERYHWPGNIRELGNVIERAVALFPGPKIQLSDLPEAVRANDALHGAQACATATFVREAAIPSIARNGAFHSEALTLMKTKEQAEIVRITEALQKHRNNRLRAAAELGISRMALYKKLNKYGLKNNV